MSTQADPATQAKETLLSNARSYLLPGQKLSVLFLKPDKGQKAFIESLDNRARATLENEARNNDY